MSRIRPRIQDDPADPRHGTNNGYMNLACRCDACRQAHTLWTRDERAANQAARNARRPRRNQRPAQPKTTPEQRAAQLTICERVPGADVRDVLMALGLFVPRCDAMQETA